MRILLVEDDAMLGSAVADGLRLHGYAVDWARDGRAAEVALMPESHGIVLLDLGLPFKSGLEVLKSWRERRLDTPVLILTARDEINDRIKGLDAGADDYVIKPFDLDEILARIRALLRRQGGRRNPSIQVGNLRIDPASRGVRQGDANITLSPREFNVLLALAEQNGRVMSRAQIEETLYGWGDEIESNAVEVYIHHLRRKLGADVILTVRGAGYRVAHD